MNRYWKLHTHGDPLARIVNFIQAVWVTENLAGMIVAPDGHSHLVETPEAIAQANPFHPLMGINLTRLVAETLRQHPGKRFGILLRACELRALNELMKRGGIPKDHLLIICCDCLGTYPVEEVKWREERLTLAKDITEETLRFAPQGGIASYRYRPACQVCENPGATLGMINIGVLGLPVRQEVLISELVASPSLSALTDGAAEEELILKREKMLERIIDRHQRTRQQMIEDLEQHLPGSVDALLDHLQECGVCHQCVAVCPICAAYPPSIGVTGRLVKEDVIHWLASCVGCGMCEQACPEALPLTSIFNRIRDQLVVEGGA